MDAKSKKKKIIVKGKCLKNKGVMDCLPFLSGRVAPRNIEEAKKILSRLISAFVRGKVADQKSKTLCYLLNSYVMMVRDNDFENRLQLLESTLQGDK